MAKAIDRGRIDPIDPQLYPSDDGADRVLVILRAPTELPPAAANGEGPQPDDGELKVGVAELLGSHLRILSAEDGGAAGRASM